MSILINKDKCIGCGMCSEVCPGSLLRKDSDGKMKIAYPKDCWGCCSCIKECKFDAISLYLGADIGGMGSKMTAKTRDHYIDWDILKSDGSRDTIVIDKNESNKY